MERSDPGNHHMRAGIRGRGQSHPRSSFSVVRTDNKPRTQNGHIRNDTRDVLRRISGPSNGAICRRMCVARDRACTRVTLQNLHGKEGVDGSSPSEGSEKAPQNGVFCIRAGLTLPPLARVWKAFWKNGSFRAYPAAASSSATLKIELERLKPK